MYMTEPDPFFHIIDNIIRLNESRKTFPALVGYISSPVKLKWRILGDAHVLSLGMYSPLSNSENTAISPPIIYLGSICMDLIRYLIPM